MNKHIVYILLTLVFVLSACAEKGTEKTAEKEKIEVSAPTENTEELSKEKEETEEAEEAEEAEEFVDEVLEPLYELDATWGFQPIDDANPKVVLLTIDDAPNKHSLDMAKTLKELEAPAIFFVNGHLIETDEKKAVLKEIHEMGFAIGNHTNTHPYLKQISEEQQKEEILKVSDMIEEIIGERPKFFRAPFGENPDFTKEVVKDDGMLLMNWTFGYDWVKQYMEPSALADIMVNTKELRDGANLLMHDREWTAGALKDIVEGLREKGYEFIDPVTIKGVE